MYFFPNMFYELLEYLLKDFCYTAYFSFYQHTQLYSPILEGDREFPQDLHPFLTFSDSIGSFFFMPNFFLLLNPFSAEKIQFGLSLSHLVPKIICCKVGKIFQQNLSFDNFKALCTNFFLDFRTCQPPFFFIVLRSFLPLIFPKSYVLFSPFFHYFFIWWRTHDTAFLAFLANKHAFSDTVTKREGLGYEMYMKLCYT